ncbi:MAG: hypothetical protein K6G70_07455 [Bacteroidaceae bacterium]|nr:hypothetical protein [Bacteroidaceae bacterium]
MILKRNRTTGWTTPLHLLLLSVLLMVGCGWLFTSCSEDVDDMPVPAQIEESVPETDMALVTMLPAMKDAAAKNGARRVSSWVIPTTQMYTTFYNYDALYAGITNYQSLTTKAVDVFFTTGTDASRHGRLHYNKTKGWKLTLNDGSDPTDPSVMAQADYYVYGFIPRNAADNANISLRDGSSSYEDGAKLTLYGMPSVMSDACVIVGAREGFKTGSDPDYTYYDGGYTDTNSNSSYDDGTDTRTNRLQTGDFKFKYNNTKDGEGHMINCMFLLFDHLCAALDINYKVDGDYAAMRTIKLKKIHMKTANGDGITKKTDVTITLKHTTDGADPIESIVYEHTSVVSTGDDVFVSETDDGVQLETTSKTFVGHFMPSGTTTVILTSTYDVYDNNKTTEHPEGNLVRKDCVATNTVRLNELVGHFTATERGKKYTVDLTIKPTFLYVMSEPDLDNPTVTIE